MSILYYLHSLFSLHPLAAFTPMVTWNNDTNTWTRSPEPKLLDILEFETCVGDTASLSTEDRRRSTAPTNYVRVFKQNVGVKGQYLLDLSLPPPPFVPGVDTNAKNVSLHTTSGSIIADIWLIHDGSARTKRVSLDLRSDNGVVRAKVHDLSSLDGSSRARPRLDVQLYAKYGDISISLPPCFRGPITIRTGDDRIAFSPALEECTALLSDVPGVRVYFVGDRPRRGKWGTDNEDDEDEAVEEPLDELEACGKFTSVRLNMDGEDELPRMELDGWWTFCSGADRFFTTGRVH
ncbi:hypothetical protein BJV74DRAFT_852878 [Russula compacta]|nr:hypothetical protein BJV74DRAFT_852878 [Russula compacta]